MYEPSKSFSNFFISGFQHWDGALALPQLKVGTQLTMVAEPDNPNDHRAIALHYDSLKLGYVPAEDNETLAQLMYFGHGNVFEAVVLGVNPDNDPWRQVYVGVRVVDARTK